MNVVKKLLLVAALCIFVNVPSFSASVQFNQVIDLKKTMWGYATIIYSASEDLVKQKNYLIGNLTFNKDKFNEYFSAPNVEIYKSTVGKSTKDASQLQVDIILKFKSIDDLNKIKALTGTKISTYQSDTGLVITNTISPSFVKDNDLSQIYGKLSSEDEIRSSNGKGNNKEVTFFRGKGYIEGPNDMYFVATLAKEGKPKAGNNAANKEETNSKKDEKSCGLFGFELPLILSLAYAFSRSRKSKS